MRIKAHDIQINCEISGKEDAPIIVLSHSLSSSMVMWNPQLDVLEPDYRVLRYDMRGHGRSDVPQGSYTLEQLAADVISVLDTLEIDTVHFVGLSIGGMIGQCLGLNYSDRLRSLVLCDTASVIPVDARPLFEDRKEAARKEGMQALVEGTLERWFTPDFLKLNPPVIDVIRQQILATPVAGYAGCSDAILGLDYQARLSEIPLPTLIMVGEDDPGTPVTASEAIHAAIPHSELKVIPSAAHLSNIEQADTFNETFLAFLKDHC